MLRRSLQQKVSLVEKVCTASTSRSIQTATGRATPSKPPPSRQQIQRKKKELRDRKEIGRRFEESTRPDPILGHQLNTEGEQYWKSSELYKVILSKDEVWGVREDRRGNLVKIENANEGESEVELGPKRVNFGLNSEEDRRMLFSDLPSVMQQDVMNHVEEPSMIDEKLLFEIQQVEERETAGVDILSRVLDLKNASGKGIQVENTRRIVNHFGARPEGDERGPDTGSVEVQAAVLTYRIRNLYEHLEDGHRHDNSNRRSMNLLIHQRAGLLKYLKRKSPSRYEAILPRIGVTARAVEGEVVPPGKPRMKIAS